MVSYDHRQHTTHLFIFLPDDDHHPPPSHPPPTGSRPIPPARSHRRPLPRHTLHIHLVTGVEGQRLRAYQATTHAHLMHTLATQRPPDHADPPTPEAAWVPVESSEGLAGERDPGDDPRQPAPSRVIDHLHQRRLAAAQRFTDGATQAQIARELGVSAQTASRWHRAWQDGGTQALRTRRRGPPARLTPSQWHQLERALAQGAQAFGLHGDHWTLTRIAAVVHQLAGVRYHPNYLAALLHQHGWSPHHLTPEADDRKQTARTTWAKQP